MGRHPKTSTKPEMLGVSKCRPESPIADMAEAWGGEVDFERAS
jgi:hypothetical protein